MTRGAATAGVWSDLFGLSDRWGRTIAWGAVIGRVAMIPIAAVTYLLAPDATEEGYSGVLTDLGPAEVIATLVFAPFAESLVIVFMVWLFGVVLRAPVWLTALLVGAAFVPLHGLVLASFTVFPMFALMGAIQFNWRRKGREWTGFWVITTIHFLGNLAAVGFHLISA